MWGPLKGQIEREGIKVGWSAACRCFAHLRQAGQASSSSRAASHPHCLHPTSATRYTLLQGMSKAYRTLIRMLERQYGGVPASSAAPAASAAAPASGAKAVGVASGKQAGQPLSLTATAGGGGEGGEAEGRNIAALLQNPQTNAAAFLAIIVVRRAGRSWLELVVGACACCADAPPCQPGCLLHS